MGDCNGIGLEVWYKAITDFQKSNSKLNNKKNEDISFSIAGNLRTIEEYFEKLKIKINISDNNLIVGNFICPIINSGKYSKVSFGSESKSAGELAASSIEKALDLTLQNKFDAMVTLPVSKSVLYKAGWKFPGHTEMIASVCKVKNPLMILCTDKVRVGLATIHIPIKEVHRNLKKSEIINIAEKFLKSLNSDFGIKFPKIAVLGLNPHAGESGDIGKEEITTIIPAIEFLKKSRINIEGPFPADGFFGHESFKNYDGILAMYHDQGLIPLKLLAKGRGVNFTAGLPVVRTSPDHGTAFEIAGKNIADHRSTLNAIKLATIIVTNRNIIFTKMNVK
jgi:4-hydroxythreonine-4-phosphate dehydrogenase